MTENFMTIDDIVQHELERNCSLLDIAGWLDVSDDDDVGGFICYINNNPGWVIFATYDDEDDSLYPWQMTLEIDECEYEVKGLNVLDCAHKLIHSTLHSGMKCLLVSLSSSKGLIKAELAYDTLITSMREQKHKKYMN